MAENSKIQWTDHTFNPWFGCTKVSPGCANCYAENLMDTIWNKVERGKGNPRKLTSEKNWNLPLKWDKEAAKQGVRKKVFCASLADVFDEEISWEWRVKLFNLIRKTTNLDWLILTKRPKIAKEFFDKYEVSDFEKESFSSKIWIGTSVENQKAANERIPILAQIPVKIRFISGEPLLENVKLNLEEYGRHPDYAFGIDWVIVGGESGNKARRMDLDWVRNIRNQCQQAEVKFFFKQFGSVLAKELGLTKTGHDFNEPNFPEEFKIREMPETHLREVKRAFYGACAQLMSAMREEIFIKRKQIDIRILDQEIEYFWLTEAEKYE